MPRVIEKLRNLFRSTSTQLPQGSISPRSFMLRLPRPADIWALRFQPILRPSKNSNAYASASAFCVPTMTAGARNKLSLPAVHSTMLKMPSSRWRIPTGSVSLPLFTGLIKNFVFMLSTVFLPWCWAPFFNERLLSQISASPYLLSTSNSRI